jgi:large subunit ribosomal protein L25
MTNTTLAAERREGTGKGVARKLRQAGKVPAVLYGRDLEPLHLAIDAHQANLLFRSVPVDNTIIELAVEGEQAPFQTLVREIQTHPYRGSLVHVDFLRIEAGVRVEMTVPLHLVGKPIGVDRNGGVLEQVLHDLPVACIPSRIPESIEVDVSGLDVHDTLRVADLVVGEGIEVLLPGDRTVCSVAAARAAEGPEVEEAEPGVGLVGEAEDES